MEIVPSYGTSGIPLELKSLGDALFKNREEWMGLPIVVTVERNGKRTVYKIEDVAGYEEHFKKYMRGDMSATPKEIEDVCKKLGEVIPERQFLQSSAFAFFQVQIPYGWLVKYRANL